jgi:hypothetical protein
MAKFRLGEKVKLKSYYLRAMNKSVQEQFSGSLVIVGIEDSMIRLSNGKSVGLCRLSCSTNNIERVSPINPEA